MRGLLLTLGAGSIGVTIGLLAALAVVFFLVLRSGGKGGAATSGSTRTCGGCNRAMLPDWTKCLFCGWVPPPPSAQLEFICGPLVGQVVPLQVDVTTIGSIGGNTIVLADPAVSRKHIGIRRDGGGYELADLGSSNGVYVNGTRTPKKVLVPGDVIRIGTSEMIFRTK